MVIFFLQTFVMISSIFFFFEQNILFLSTEYHTSWFLMAFNFDHNLPLIVIITELDCNEFAVLRRFNNYTPCEPCIGITPMDISTNYPIGPLQIRDHSMRTYAKYIKNSALFQSQYYLVPMFFVFERKIQHNQY